MFNPSLIAPLGFVLSEQVVRESMEGRDTLTASFRDSSERATLTVWLIDFTESEGRQRYIDRLNGLLSVGTIDNLPSGGPSLLPAGDKSRFSADPEAGGLNVHIFLGGYAVSAALHYGGSGPRGAIVWSGSDKAGDHLAVEGFCRDALATAVGSELRASGNVVVNGITITGVKQDDYARRSVPIRAWCAARGITLNANPQHGTAAFTYGDRMFVIPLAAASIKAGAQWKPLDGYALSADGKWLAPLDGLEAAIR